MRKILYFLMGISLSMFILLSYAHAEVKCSDVESAITDFWTNFFSSPNHCDTVSVNIAGSVSEAQSYMISTYGGLGSIRNVTIDGTSYGYYSVVNNGDPDVYTYTAGCCAIVPGGCALDDTDGDDIPDDQDLYPNDPEPFNVKLISYQTDDGTSTGTHVRECYQTDKGDVYCIGADYDENKSNILVYNGTWIPYEDANSDTTTSGTISDSTEGASIEQPTYTTDVSTGDVDADTDSSLKSGTSSTGSETDNEALQGIMDNTAAAADNTKRQGEYLKALNAAIENMDRNIALKISDDESNRDIDGQQAQAAQSEFDNTNVSEYYNDTNFNGTLTQGTDYQPASDLENESWLTGFISNNPLKTALDSSGFEMINETSKMEFTIEGLGTHSFDLGPFESQFILAGNILLAITSLSALILIAWR